MLESKRTLFSHLMEHVDFNESPDWLSQFADKWAWNVVSETKTPISLLNIWKVSFTH